MSCLFVVTFLFTIIILACLGPRDAIPFEITLHNEGGGWEPTTNRFRALLGSLYYVIMTGLNLVENPMHMQLVHNVDRVVAGIRLGCVGGPTEITRSRAIIVRIEAGDQLRLRIPDGFSVEGCAPYYCSAFSGFRFVP